MLRDDSKAASVMRGALPWVLMGLFLISISWFAALYIRGVRKDSLDMEFAKALLDVGVVSVAATILSLLTIQYRHQTETEQRERDRRIASDRENNDSEKARLQFRDDLLKSTLARITATYNSTKRARRQMRALGQYNAPRGPSIRLERYDACMADINDAQLELEAIKSDVKTSSPVYPSVAKLTAGLRDMEKYLGELIQEYEQVRGSTDPLAPSLPVAAVPRFTDFLGPSAGSKFEEKFSAAHTAAREAIRGDLLHLGFSEQEASAS